MSWEEILKKVPLTPNERKQVEELVRFRNMDEQEAEKVVRRKAGKLEGRKRIEEIDEDRWKGRFVKSPYGILRKRSERDIERDNYQMKKRLDRANKNLKDKKRELQYAIRAGKEIDSLYAEYRKAKERYDRILSESKKASEDLARIERENIATRREEKRKIQEEIKQVKQDFIEKKNVVIQEFLKYVDSFGIGDNKPLKQIMDIPQTGEGRVFRKIYEKASKGAGIYGFVNRIINYENYKDFNVNEKINQFKNSLERAKRFYKDEVREVYLNRIRNR